MKTELENYDNSWYSPKASKFKIIIWLIINSLFFRNSLNLSSSLKIFFLRLFGAEIGKGVLIKPAVNIKYPWNLKIGNHVWIGENVWIDNLCEVIIHNNVCLSQGSMLLTGNHNFKKKNFDLIVQNIVLEDGVWIGAKSIVCPGVKCFSHAVLAVNSVANKNLEPYMIFQGNPAKPVKKRIIT